MFKSLIYTINLQIDIFTILNAFASSKLAANLKEQYKHLDGRYRCATNPTTTCLYLEKAKRLTCICNI